MSKAREKLAEGIISKLLDTFYTKKAEAYAKLMMKADPEIGAATLKLQHATKDLKDKLMKLNQQNMKFFKDNDVKVDSEGFPNIADLRKLTK